MQRNSVFDKCDKLMLVLIWDGYKADVRDEGYFAYNLNRFELGTPSSVSCWNGSLP